MNLMTNFVAVDRRSASSVDEVPFPTAQGEHVRRLLMAVLPRMNGYAYRLTNNRADADDLVQELVVRVLAAQDQFILGTNFRAWCFTILHNLFVSTKRQAARQTAAGDEDFALPSDGTQELDLYTRQVVDALARLPDKLRCALTMHSDGSSYAEIAANTRVGIGTVKSRLARARVAIRCAVQDAEDTPVFSSESSGCTWNFHAAYRGRRAGAAISL